MARIVIVVPALLAVLLAGCVSSLSSDVYTRDQAQRAQNVRMGTVDSVRRVKIEGTRSGIGAIAGGAVGGIAGSTVGGGRGSDIAAVVGAVAGGLAGQAAEQAGTQQDGLEITVRMDNGSLLSVVQAADVDFRPGERVRVVTGSGKTRVSH